MKTGNTRIIGIIPSRMGSTRLPGKPLLDICGKPLIQRVWEAAKRSVQLQRIIVATDDERIAGICKDIGAECVMTPSELPSGTDRIMRAYEILKENADIVVNIQGDEPLLYGEIIDELLGKFIESQADVGTLIKRITTLEEIEDPSVVKVEIKPNMTAKCFSREPIPYLKELPKEEWLNQATFWKHIGVYAYKIDALWKFVSLPVSESEKKERLEQLRLLETGAVYYCMETDAELMGVDTPEDLERVRDYFKILFY
ncbi:3-deoxy-manno-octulosonate cytidylyltransferase [Bacteroidota bacterium]